jgi:hypothetical protein
MRTLGWTTPCSWWTGVVGFYSKGHFSLDQTLPSKNLGQGALCELINLVNNPFESRKDLSTPLVTLWITAKFLFSISYNCGKLRRRKRELSLHSKMKENDVDIFLSSTRSVGRQQDNGLFQFWQHLFLQEVEEMGKGAVEIPGSFTIFISQSNQL